MWRAYGRPVKQIADALGISPRTVKMHLEEIRRKLYAEDLVNAVWIAGQMGLIG
jgi:DNA-binding NarL/FixJ family response regulator